VQYIGSIGKLQYRYLYIWVLIKACLYSGHIHIFTEASVPFLLQIFVQVCLCTLFCRCAVASCTGCYRNVQMSIGNCLTMQALACLLVVQFRTVWFVVVIYTLDTRIWDNLTYLSAKFKGKILSCIPVDMVWCKLTF